MPFHHARGDNFTETNTDKAKVLIDAASAAKAHTEHLLVAWLPNEDTLEDLEAALNREEYQVRRQAYWRNIVWRVE